MTSQPPEMPAVLDDHVIEVYVAEMTSLVADVVSAHVFDHRGRERWSNTDEPQKAPEEVDCSAPFKRKLPAGHYGFDFPLLADGAETLVLRLRVANLDPPSLSFVATAIAPALACLSRQIRIDTDLTSRFTLSDTHRSRFEVGEAMEQLVPTGSLQEDLQNVINICQSVTGCASVLLHLPGLGIDVHAPLSASGSAHLRNLSAGIFDQQKSSPRPQSLRLKLPNGKSAHAACVPVMTRRGAADGVVVLLNASRESQHAAAARTVAGKVAAMLPVKESQKPCCNRYDLLHIVEKTMQVQPTLSHSMIYLNIDKTHAINDAFGYTSGDKALARCRQIILESARANDVVAHLGGDRFAIFLPGASVDTALAKVDQLLRFLSQETLEDGRKSLKLSASAGVACSESVKKGAEELLILAEVASRGAHDRGGGQAASFQDVDNSIIQRRSDVDKVGFLQTALIENRFSLHAQRILPINANQAHKFELLARLRDKNVDQGSAHHFLAAAERYQMMAALDRWVVNSALKSLSEAENPLEVSLATFCINISAQSLQDESFVDHIEARIADAGVPAEALCFELTETSLVRHIDKAQHFVNRLQRLGCLVALDDFGTGYSSFAYLKTLPINVLKIDGSFVRDILECSLSKTIVSSVVRMAEDIGAETVAEHVENELVRAQLKDLGVHYIQGFVVHRPEPLENVLQDFEASLIKPEELSGSFNLKSDTLELLVSGAK